MRREKEQMVSEESENERKDMPPPSWVGWCGTKSTVNDEPTRVSFAERFTTRAAAAWETRRRSDVLQTSAEKDN